MSPNDAVMQEEIFGPILPVLTFESSTRPKRLLRIVRRRWPCISLVRSRGSAALCAKCPWRRLR
ncbi:MAG: hypothetical protein ACLU0O_03180 [Collinsella sp.]